MCSGRSVRTSTRTFPGASTVLLLNEMCMRCIVLDLNDKPNTARRAAARFLRIPHSCARVIVHC